MWSRNHFVKSQQRVISRRWFLAENIERCTRYDARSDCLVKGVFINQTTARTIDDAHAPFHFCKSFFTHNATSLRCWRCGL